MGMTTIQELLTASRDSKKGVVVYFNGGSIGGLVTAIAADGVVEMRSQQYTKILVRMDAVQAVAMA